MIIVILKIAVVFYTVFSKHCPLFVMGPFLMGAPTGINETLRTELASRSYLSISNLHLLDKILLLLESSLKLLWYKLAYEHCLCESLHNSQILAFILRNLTTAAEFFESRSQVQVKWKHLPDFAERLKKTGQRTSPFN